MDKFLFTLSLCHPFFSPSPCTVLQFYSPYPPLPTSYPTVHIGPIQANNSIDKKTSYQEINCKAPLLKAPPIFTTIIF